MHIYISGAGVSGLAAAAELSANPDLSVTVFEASQTYGTYASGRNAAIARSYEADPLLSWLAKESILEMYRRNLISDVPLIQKTGLFMDPYEQDYWENDFKQAYPDEPEIDDFISERREYQFLDGSTFRGLFLPAGGVFDPHAILSDFVSQATQNHAKLSYNTKILSVDGESGRITKITVSTGKATEEIYFSPDDILILSSGSWSAAPPEGISPLPLTPFKRHLFFLAPPPGESFPKDMPVFWREKNEFYFRREGQGILATHGDQNQADCDDYSAEERALEEFAASAAENFPFLSHYGLNRYWGCLRTFALDNRPAIGFDPHWQNLFWNTGYGGRGMSLAYSIGPLVQKILSQGPVKNETEIENSFTAHRFF